ncbi:MAG: 16S rRNA processing protein RimM [Sphingomonadales bacterium 32-64-17]|nr:MAG: 16S rRNA processing protein RimM [Sphingomonadales bacterium 32-64-17]
MELRQVPESQAQTITLAAIAGAHGITGDVRLKLFGEGLPSLKQHKSFNEGALTLTKLRDDGKGGAIARFAEVSSRTDAEKLRGTVLAVARDSLPPLAEGEYYYADLIGLPAVSDTGEALGRVVAVENFGASDVIEIERPAEEGKKPQRFMVPMLPEAVPEWNAERIVVSANFAED